MLPERFINIHNIQSIEIKKKFQSRENNVYLIRAYKDNNEAWDLVVKRTKSRYAIKREIEILKHLNEHGVMTPEIYYYTSNLMVMKYISGETMSDKFLLHDKKTSTELKQLIEELINWFISYYKAMANWNKNLYIKADINLTNFIISNDFNDKIYGLDFENCRPGIVEEDIGRLCANILICNPSNFTYNHELLHTIIKITAQEIRIDPDRAIKEMKVVLERSTDKIGCIYSRENIKDIINSLRRQQYA